MFIDKVKIYVKAGKGGNGCQSLYRDKYMRYPIRNGGDGGKGADVIIQASSNIYTLYDFKFRQHFAAENGQHGGSNKKKGRNGSDLIIKVPCGTIIKDADTDFVIRDLAADKEAVIVAKGGARGLGNHHKRDATPGSEGEDKNLIFDLKIIADVGIIGFPNVGKSTLISKITNAHPKIASYPFTTKSPVLGKVLLDSDSFLIADIPGLIEGSSSGRGLGDEFLRHVERTKVLIHMVDISSFEGRDPVDDYKTINSELKKYGNNVFKKPQIVVANKIDITGADKNLEKFKKAVKKKVYPISALKSEGLEVLIDAVREIL